MTDELQRYLDLASGLTRTTLSATERALAQFVRQGEIAADHAERLLDEIVTRSVDGSGALAQLVRTEVERALRDAGYVRADELDALRREVRELRAQRAARNGEPDAGGVGMDAPGPHGTSTAPHGMPT